MVQHVLRVGVGIFVALLVAGCCCPRPVCCESTQAASSAASDKREVWVHLTTLRVPEGRVDALLANLQLTPSDPARELTDAEAKALWTRVQADDSLRILQAPKILAIEGQEATVRVGEMIRFAKSTARTNERGGLTFSMEDDPDGPVSLGFQARIVAQPTADGKRIALELETTDARLPEPVENPGAIGAAAFREKVMEHKLALSIDMRNGGSVVFIGKPAVIEDEEGPGVRVAIVKSAVLGGLTPN